MSYYIVLGDAVYKPSGLLLDPYTRSYLYLVNVLAWKKILFQPSAEYTENQTLSGGVSSILRSGLILQNIYRMFLLSG